MKTPHYNVITVERSGMLRYALILLSSRVEQAMTDEGWVPQGGVSIDQYHVSQAMVLYTERNEWNDIETK